MNAPPTAEQQFARALAEHRLQPTGIVADGQLHRFDGPDEKHGKRSAWYVLYGDGDLPAGAPAYYAGQDRSRRRARHACQ
jgi:putative DNA primase/helicase